MAACHQLRFDVTGNSAIRSADRPWKPYPRTKHNVSPYLSWSVLLCSCFLLQTIITRSQAVDRIADRTQHSTFRVTWRDWRHRSRDHLIAHIPFPNGSPLEQSLFLQPFSRYCALSVFGSRVWPFKVTWRRLIAHMPFPVGGPLEPSLYL